MQFEYHKLTQEIIDRRKRDYANSENELFRDAGRNKYFVYAGPETRNALGIEAHCLVTAEAEDICVAVVIPAKANWIGFPKALRDRIGIPAYNIGDKINVEYTSGQGIEGTVGTLKIG